MKTIKFIIFIELLAMAITGAIHLAMHIIGEEFPPILYLCILILILGMCLFSIYIVAPFADWFFNDGGN